MLAAASGWTSAQVPYPMKPIRIIVPFPPGGSNDLVGRYVGQKLTARLGQQTVIDNRAGADAIIGTQLAASAPPDGYEASIWWGMLGPAEMPRDIVNKQLILFNKRRFQWQD